MFSAKKLDKLVARGIISPEQKSEILGFEEDVGSGFEMKALSLLGIFTIGVGVISLVAANWDAISSGIKLFVMFALLFGTAGGAVYYRQVERADEAEKWLVALFLFIGAAIGLVIQIYQLSGGDFYTPFGFWCLATLPLLFAAKKKYVAYFWVPLFLGWCALYLGDYWGENLTWLLGGYAVLAAMGMLLVRYVPSFAAGYVLQKNAFFAFYLVFAVYIFVESLPVSTGILGVTSLAYYFGQDYRVLRLNIKFAGLWVISLYIYLGDTIGLFSTGMGMILSGVVLIAVIKGVSHLSKKVIEEKKDA